MDFYAGIVHQHINGFCDGLEARAHRLVRIDIQGEYFDRQFLACGGLLKLRCTLGMPHCGKNVVPRPGEFKRSCKADSRTAACHQNIRHNPKVAKVLPSRPAFTNALLVSLPESRATRTKLGRVRTEFCFSQIGSEKRPAVRPTTAPAAESAADGMVS